MKASKEKIISKLRSDMLRWEGFKPPSPGKSGSIGIKAIEAAFPNAIFPTGVIHEFISDGFEQLAATEGFIGGLLHSLMKQSGVCIWISASRMLFPPSLKLFGVEPDKLIFIDLKQQKDILWTTEEALKCVGISAVIAEMKSINFAESRRLQLATEKSRVSGLIIRTDPDKVSATTCTARWRITPLASQLTGTMPGVGFPRWNVELLKVRNGNPGKWQIEWSADHFSMIKRKISEAILQKEKRKAV
jgi:protein ImuA